MASSTPVTFDNATTTSFSLGADGRIAIAVQSQGPRSVDFSATGLSALSRASGDSENGAKYGAMAAALAERDAGMAQSQSFNSSGAGFKPAGMKT